MDTHVCIKNLHLAMLFLPKSHISDLIDLSNHAHFIVDALVVTYYTFVSLCSAF